MTEQPGDQGRGIDGTSRTAARLAWSSCALTLALTALSLLLFDLNLSHPGTHIYDYWLENTISSLSLAPVGALVASRRPGNPVGWLMCLTGLAYGFGHFGGQYAIYALSVQLNPLPGSETFAWIVSWILPIIVGLSVFTFLLFPTGRPPGRRWRWLAWLTVAFVVAGVTSAAFSLQANVGLGQIRNPLGIEGASYVYDMVMNVSIFLFFAVVVSQFVRLRRATGVERQQIKWFAYAVAATVAGLFLAYYIPSSTDAPPWFEQAGYTLNVIVTPAIPIAIGIAILRHRLFDIDLIINRTLVYGMLSATLALTYFGGVAGLQYLFRVLSGQERLPQLAVVASTLAIAALFNPLRRWLQAFVDRRFYRRKYDARQTLETFSAKLREETDLEALDRDLVAVVRETMDPAHVWFWLRPDDGSGRGMKGRTG